MSEESKIQVAGFGGAEDAWLSGIMGRPAYRLGAGRGTGEVPRGPFFAYLKLPSSDLEAANRAAAAGFFLAETAVTLEGDAVSATGGDARFAGPSDEEAVAAVAGGCFVQSRFHADPLVDNAIADRIKGEWARNFFLGRRGTHMVVAEHHGRVAGFLQIVASGGVLLIDLIGVAPAAQGRGLGRAMIGFAAAGIPGWSRMRVGTQLSNASAMALYQKLGLRVAASSYSFHFHAN